MSISVLIVDDEKAARQNLGSLLERQGYITLEAETLADARKQIDQGSADVVLLDARLEDGYGPNYLAETAHNPARPPIILITAYGDIEMAVQAMKNGAHDFFEKPILDIEPLSHSIQRAGEIVAMRRELFHLRKTQRDQSNFIIGKSPAMEEIYGQAMRAANASVSVLITGETGTGKEVLARAIHNMGTRSDKPFIAINCAAIQSTMLEAELFGFEAGAFTGAEKRKHGLMETADGGILFLDEISSMPIDMQAKLLRALEERAFRHMGGNKLIDVDVQILAASNRNLDRLMEEGDFRDDLYYRLKVVDLHIPPLRERRQDIPELVGYFISANNPRMGLNIENMSTQAMEKLIKHEWSGNIRELRNVIERAMLFCDDAMIDVKHLPPEFSRAVEHV